jgi:glycosyltransferase involved in cell wall biosynthesis
MASDPSIAAIVPVRNGGALLAPSLESIRAQNYAPLEIAIVDDASTDGTRDYLRGLNGFCPHLIELDGRGPAAARNAGIQATRSDFVAFLDADDLWPPETLHALSVALTGNPQAGFAQGLIRNFRRRPEGWDQYFTRPYRFINLGACLWRRSVFETVGLLDESLNLCEDLDFLMRCWEKDIAKVEIEQVTLFYRRHEGNMTHGLSGAGLGSVQAFKRRIDRIQKGKFNPAAPRRFDAQSYMGIGPPKQDF